MNNHKSEIEIMAPASTFESLMAVIQAGAGAVYFGVGQLNMRADGVRTNFTPDDMPKIVEICRQHHVRCYLTLNVIIYENDMELMKATVDKAKESHVSAIIACDHAVLSYCKTVGIEAHISTQANIPNIETVEFYSQYADAMVLARELSLEQVTEITEEIKRRQIKGPSGNLVRIEVFIHGSFCMAVSSKCYLSLHTYDSSPNSGQCMKNCRREYIVTDKKDGTEYLVDNDYIFSAKDLCTISFIDKIIASGATVLKIEGRGRASDYAYTTTKCYREAADAYLNGTYTKEKVIEWEEKLAAIYNRGYWSGYYLGTQMGEHTSKPIFNAIKNKIYVAKVLKYTDAIKSGEFTMEAHTLQGGDEVIITGAVAGFIQMKIKELRVDNKVVKKVKAGDVFTLIVPSAIANNDKLYKVITKETPFNKFMLKITHKLIKSSLGTRIFRKIKEVYDYKG